MRKRMNGRHLFQGLKILYILIVFSCSVQLFGTIKKMGNGEFQIPNNSKQEWEERNISERRLFYNKLTKEQFQFKVLRELKSDLHISQLIQRSIYPIPKTPKVIILNDSRGEISILVQKIESSFQSFIAQFSLQLQLLQTIKEIVATLWTLYQRFGPFTVSPSLLGGTTRKQIIVWINQTFQLCEIQVKLPKVEYPELVMLTQIMSIILTYSPLQIHHQLFITPPNSFRQFLDAIEEIIILQRSSLRSQKEALSNKNTSNPYSSSPRCRMDQLKPRKPSIGANISNLVVQKTRIPKFLKEKPIPKKLAKVQSSKEGRQLNESSNDNTKYWKRQTIKYQNNPFITVSKVRSLHTSPIRKNLNQGYCNDLSFVTTKNSNQQSNTGYSDPLTSSKESMDNSGRLAWKPLSNSHKSMKWNSPKGLKHQDKGFLSSHNLLAAQIPKNKRNPNEANVEFNIGDVTFQKCVEESSFVSLHSYCKDLSHSRILFTQNLDSMFPLMHQSIDSQENTQYSVVIKNDQESKLGKLTLYQEFSKVIY